MAATRINPEYQEKPTVLYDGGSAGTNGTVTLSQSSANFDYMRIFFYTNDYVHGSTVVYRPNDRRVILAVQHVSNNGYSIMMKARVVNISGTTIATMPTNRYAEAAIDENNRASGFSKNNNIYILRVEAWNA